MRMGEAEVVGPLGAAGRGEDVYKMQKHRRMWVVGYDSGWKRRLRARERLPSRGSGSVHCKKDGAGADVHHRDACSVSGSGGHRRA
jgi:hypothetical protein